MKCGFMSCPILRNSIFRFNCSLWEALLDAIHNTLREVCLTDSVQFRKVWYKASHLSVVSLVSPVQLDTSMLSAIHKPPHWYKRKEGSKLMPVRSITHTSDVLVIIQLKIHTGEKPWKPACNPLGFLKQNTILHIAWEASMIGWQ